MIDLHPESIMPITAKLSRRFYETLGDEVANEMVDWLNAVAATIATRVW